MNYCQSSAAFFAPPSSGRNDTSSRYAQPAIPALDRDHLSIPIPTQGSPDVQDGLDVIRRVARVTANFTDVAVLPGQYLSAAVVAREKMRDLLITSVHRFAAESVDAYRVSAETAEASVGFIKALGGTMQLPKIAPDGEGGLMAVWDDGDAPIALVVDNWNMHLVTGATTPRAQYFDSLPFDGTRLPEELVVSIPKY
jgi:hypothetical protein